MRLPVIVVFCLSLIYAKIQHSQGSLCVSSGNDTTCGTASTWAVNTNISIAHDITPPTMPSFNILYKLNSEILCEYAYQVTGSCSLVRGAYCQRCLNNYTSDKSVLAELAINLDITKNGSVLTYDLARSFISNHLLHTFSLTTCMSKTNLKTTGQESYFNITSESNGYYMSKGSCNCVDVGEELFNTDGTRSNEMAICGYNAEWVGCEEVQCWSGPRNITSSQANTTVNARSPFKCDFVEGFPNATSYVFKIEGEVKKDDYLLNSDDHGKNLTCQIFSNYTEKAQNGPYESVVPHLIEVHFAPKNSYISDESSVIKVNDSKRLNYSVLANPRDGDINVNVEKKPDLEASAIFTMIRTYTKNAQHIYEYIVTVSSDEEYGSYEICAFTESPAGNDCANLSIRNFPPPTTSQPDAKTFHVTTDAKKLNDQGIPAAIIGVIVAGAILIILIAAVVFILWKRRKKAPNTDHGREERINELYGSAQYPTPATENPVRVTQEKANVLYGTSSGTASRDVVEYAMANRDGIVSDDVVEYATSNSDVVTRNITESTSTAEQPCSSTADVYAQINKKKGKLNPGYNKEMPDAKADTSAVTYTVVDKPKKRKKDDVPEVYATVNKPRTKG